MMPPDPYRSALVAIAADIMRSRYRDDVPDGWDNFLAHWAISLRNLADGHPPGPAPVPPGAGWGKG